MLPKIAAALARALDPIKPIQRPGQERSLAKSAEGGDGGYSPASYQGPETTPSSDDEKKNSEGGPGEVALPAVSENKAGTPVPFVPGLTQVILDLQTHRVERSSSTAAQTYETGAKEQKKNAHLPKGSMLDKKAG